MKKLKNTIIFFLILMSASFNASSSEIDDSYCETEFLGCIQSIPDCDNDIAVEEFIENVEVCLQKKNLINICGKSDLVSSFIEIVDTPSL